jgi:hypothetical protein
MGHTESEIYNRRRRRKRKVVAAPWQYDGKLAALD